jgi:trimeric autotransporter adhesin
MVFVVMVIALGAGTFMLREAATAQEIGGAKGYAGDNGPAIEASLDAPGGLAVTPGGEVYFADSNNHVIRRIDAQNNITTVVGNNALGAAFGGDFAAADAAQLDTPSAVTIAPDGDLVIADSYNHRIRRVDRETRIISTVAGSGRSDYDGDDKPATEAALHMPSAVAAAPNGDIYIADTLNYRVRMIDHATGFIHTVAGIGVPAENGNVGDGGLATHASLNMPSDVAIGPNGDIYIADMHHQRVRRIDAKTRLITTVAGTGRWGYAGDGGPATDALLAGPAGIAVVPESGGRVTIYIADYYNGHVRVVGPDGIIRDISEDGRVTFDAPARVAFAAGRGVLWIADSSRDKLVAFRIRDAAAGPAAAGASQPPKKAGE